MSRIGRLPITLPKGVTVQINGSEVLVEGSKGKIARHFHPEMKIELHERTLTVARPSDARQHRAMHGLTRALLNNMVQGVSAGFSRRLEVVGVGYRAEMDGKNLVLYVGYSHPVRMAPAEGIQFAVEERGRLIIVSGIDKELVGETTARIRKVRAPEPYKGKGIRYQGEVVRQKEGKTGKV